MSKLGASVNTEIFWLLLFSTPIVATTGITAMFIGLKYLPWNRN